jgi:hypothetical protein
MRSRQLLVIAVVVAVGAACAPRDETEELEEMAPPATETQPIAPEPAADLVVSRADFQPTSTAAGSSISGTAEVRRASGAGTPGTGATAGAAAGGEALEVHVRLQGLTAEHSWHIHQGACSTARAPVTVSFTQPLQAVAGVAETTAPIPQDKLTEQQLQSGQFSVRVHESTRQGAATIACADIQHQ